MRLAASHSASEALLAALLTDLTARQQLAVELVNANSQVVHALVADGRADIGVAVIAGCTLLALALGAATLRHRTG